MAELHSNLYFKHPKPQTQEKLVQMFRSALLPEVESQSDTLEIFVRDAESINPENGRSLVINLISKIKDGLDSNIEPEYVGEVAGFCVSHWVDGSTGIEVQQGLIEFMSDLCPGIQAQSWGCGDDDPWEYWLKYQNGKLLRCDDEPFEGEDDRIMGTIYRWWHKDMPEQIKEGFLNEDGSKKNWQPVSDADYAAWLEILEAAPDEKDDGLSNITEFLFGDHGLEDFGIPEFEKIGPELSMDQLSELHQICNDVLATANPSLETLLTGYARISACLLDLENRYQSGQEMAERNAEVFLQLFADHNGELQEKPWQEFMCRFYKESIDKLLAEQALGTLILRHDEANVFSDVLIGMLEEGWIDESYPNSMSSYEDFAVWKNILLAMAEDVEIE